MLFRVKKTFCEKKVHNSIILCASKNLSATLNEQQVMRRKNPHPKRAVNARTVLKVREKEEPLVLCSRIPDDVEANHQMRKEEEEEEDEDVKRLRRILMCVPCDDDVVEQNQWKEETAFIAKGVKRKRGHECDVCEKRFTESGSLKYHMRIHTNEKPYECDVCEKRFRASSNLKVHMRTHTKEKPYECDVCDKAFRQSGHLQNHMRIHTNERPFECHICEKRYRQANGLKYHMRTQHH